MKKLRSMNYHASIPTPVNGILNLELIGRTKADRFKCRFCHKKYISSGNLNRHIRISHQGEVTNRLLKCPHCISAFQSETARSIHVFRVHLGRNSYHCSLCNSSFNKSVSLKWHKRVHHFLPRKNSCIQSSSVPKPVKPILAERKLKRRRVKNNRTLEPATTMTKNGVEMVYANKLCCTYCPKFLSTMFSKEQHERIHTGIRPYLCEFCPASFNHPVKYNTHLAECRYLDKMVWCVGCDFHTLDRTKLEGHYRRMHGFNFESDVELEFLNREVLRERDSGTLGSGDFSTSKDDQDSGSSSSLVSSDELEEAVQSSISPSSSKPTEKSNKNIEIEPLDRDDEILRINDKLEEMFRDSVSDAQPEPTLTNKTNRFIEDVETEIMSDQLAAILEDSVSNHSLIDCQNIKVEIKDPHVDFERVKDRSNSHQADPVDEKLMKFEVITQGDEANEKLALVECKIEHDYSARVVDLTESIDDEVVSNVIVIDD